MGIPRKAESGRRYRPFDTGRWLGLQIPLPIAKKEGRPEAAFQSFAVVSPIAFSSEVVTGSREENASKQESKARF
jgi:hypothetical protein